MFVSMRNEEILAPCLKLLLLHPAGEKKGICLLGYIKELHGQVQGKYNTSTLKWHQWFSVNEICQESWVQVNTFTESYISFKRSI